MNFGRSRKHLRRLAGLALSLSVLTNCFLFADNRSRASVSLEKKKAPVTTPAKPAKVDESVKKQVKETLGNLPLSFEANAGQADSRIKFLARGRGFGMFLSPQETLLVLKSKDKKESGKGSRFPSLSAAPSEALSMRLMNANKNPRMVGMDQLPGETNYFIGNDPEKWRTRVANYERVRYEQVYPGIDMVYYGNQGQLEYDFMVAPEADPSSIKISHDGVKSMRIAPNGDLVLAMKNGEVVQRKPIVYQEVDGARREIAGEYVLTGKRHVGFKLGDYDKSRTLVIDPVLTYSTYHGGSSDDDAWAIAVDSTGAVYVTGDTNSTNFPIANAIQPNKVVTSPFDRPDLFVTKLNAAGSQVVYSTYLGGLTNDNGVDIQVDSSGVAYVLGYTDSSNFPLQNPRQSTHGGGIDTVLFKISASGSQLLYSTYHGGSNHDVASALDIDLSGNMYVTGYTISTNYPTANAFDATGGGTCNDGPCDDGFVFKMNAAGNQLLYSTYLGGTTNQDRGSGIAVDSSGIAYVVGFTSGNNFPVSSPIQTWQGAQDAFVTAFSSTGTVLYSTYLGGSGNDIASAVAVDSSSNVYITGDTASTNFPTSNAFQSTRAGNEDGFVTKINSTGSAIVYSTYLGGSSTSSVEGGSDIVVDADGQAYVIGETQSADFPIVNPVQASLGGGVDVVVVKLSATGNSLIYSTFLGGSDSDFGRGIAIDSSGNAYICGDTFSTNFPTANPRQPNNAGGSLFDEDGFIAKISNVDGINITGLIADPGNNPIQGVKVTVTGSASQFTFTDANGNYTVPNLAPGGNYTLTPSKVNFNFTPTSLTFNNLTVNETGNFTGIVNQVVIDGKVKDANGTGVSGVTVTLSGSQSGSVVTTSTGTYSFSNLAAGGSYTITPTRNSDVFVPANKTFNNLSSNQTFDFTLVYSINGHVTDSLGASASGVTVTLSGGQAAQTQTDIAGNYSFSNLPAGVTYTVTPSKPNFTLTYTFTPASQTFATIAANQTANFSFITATNTSVVAVADAYVQDGTTAGTNFGSITPMLVKTSNSTGQRRDAYLKFDLTTVRRNITSAKLRFTAALSAAGAISTTAFAVNDATWTESGITWNNKPALGATQSTVSVTTTTLATYEVNVTTHVVNEKAAGRNLISLALHNGSNSSNHINVNSRESLTDKPQLLITTSDSSNAAPSVSISAPAEGAPFTAPANITINANAADTDGTVSIVDFYAGTKKVGSDNTSPYSTLWTPVEAGNYTLRAVATDNSGATTTSSPVNITVSLPNLPPQVSLTAPAAGVTFPAGGNIGLAADATDVDGSITKVDFFTGSTLIGTDNTYPYTFNWTNVPAGQHSLTAVATDNSGATNPSPPIVITAVWRTGLTPTMDAYVRDGSSASTNFGTAQELQVQQSATAGSNRETHLKFDITPVSAITSAKLRLYGSLIDTSGTNVPTAVYATTPNTWTESGSGSINWNNKPLPTVPVTALATATITDNVARWYEWDLTAYIQGEKNGNRNTISIAIKSTANSTPYAVFSSKEAATNQPQLLITTTATRNILFVTAASTPNTSEGVLKARMENLGFTVTVKQAGSNQNSAINTSDAYGKAAVVISSSVTPTNVLAKFRNVVVPVLLWEGELLDDMSMTATNDFGTETNQQHIAIIAATHPMAAGLTGTVGVFPSNNTLTWGRPTVNAVKIATVTTADTTKTTIFGYDTSALMSGSVPAPARRVGFFLHDNNGSALTGDGNALFDAAIKWLTQTIVTPSISTLNPTFGTIGTPVTITGYNFGDTQGASTVTFNGVNATSTTWTSTSIIAAVPSGANSGPVIVVVSGLSSNSITFTVELPPVDTDADGLPDAWELQYFGNLNQGANDNPDGDALNNLQEYLQGRNPTLGTVEDSGGGVNLRIYTPLIPVSP